MVQKPSVLDSYCVVASLLSVGKTENWKDFQFYECKREEYNCKWFKSWCLKLEFHSLKFYN